MAGVVIITKHARASLRHSAKCLHTILASQAMGVLSFQESSLHHTAASCEKDAPVLIFLGGCQEVLCRGEG